MNPAILIQRENTKVAHVYIINSILFCSPHAGFETRSSEILNFELGLFLFYFWKVGGYLSGIFYAVQALRCS